MKGICLYWSLKKKKKSLKINVWDWKSYWRRGSFKVHIKLMKVGYIEMKEGGEQLNIDPRKGLSWKERNMKLDWRKKKQ